MSDLNATGYVAGSVHKVRGRGFARIPHLFMTDFLQRQWVMLSLLPRAPRSVDAASLEVRLREHGIRVNRRSIQRDLVALSSMFPLACDERSKPYGWSWAEDGLGIDVPGGMNPHAALAFKLAAEMLGSMLPRSTLSFLRAHMKRAERTLEGTSPLASWPAKVRIVPPILTRDVAASVLEVVMTSLLDERRFTAVVREGSARRQATVDPLGITYEDGTTSLVCRLDGGRPLAVPLSTFGSARATSELSVPPPRFDLDVFLRGGKRRMNGKGRSRKR
jgi:predicted DNA-binding transcriptional regulator YafY